jgi:hypothetical protein
MATNRIRDELPAKKRVGGELENKEHLASADGHGDEKGRRKR